ncbi:hypothetical protein HDU92_009082, partial [Lobulomyces angularis]
MNETNSNGIKLERNEDEIKEVVNQSETDSKNESNKKSVPFQQPLVDSNDVKDVNYLKPKKKILSQDIDSYQVKQISFFGQLFNIVLQNLNGPCPLIALINVLSLTKKINIPPIPTTSEKLLDKLNGYLLDGNLNLSESDLLKVLKELPNLKTGMIVSPRFDIPMSFVDSDQLLVFKAFGVNLVHGWCVDPQDEETFRVVARNAKSYDKLTDLIVQGEQNIFEPDQSLGTIDIKGKGKENSSDSVYQDQTNNSQKKIQNSNQILQTDTLIAKNFLEQSSTQLTYFGLTSLMENLQPNSISILFRNNHFQTLFKLENRELLQLVTDLGFLEEPTVCWESLLNVEGDSYFLDSDFREYNKQNFNNSNGGSNNLMNSSNFGINEQLNNLNLNGNLIQSNNDFNFQNQYPPTTTAQSDQDLAIAISMQQQEEMRLEEHIHQQQLFVGTENQSKSKNNT